MLTKDAERMYNSDVDENGKPKGQKLEFPSDDDKGIGGIYCDQCGDHIQSGKIYHCPNASHQDGYDLCLRCSKKKAKPPPQLSSFTLEGLAEFIRSGQCKKIAILSGAGISRSAGIPDFRSNNGIYQSLSKDLDQNAVKYGLTLKQKCKIQEDAQYVFSMELFRENPQVLYHTLGDILNKRCVPTKTHCFMKLLQNRGLLRYVFTQNVDGLERYIGIDPKKLCEVHGTFMTASCHECGTGMSIAEVRKRVKNGDIPIDCPATDCPLGFVKPDCVLFGEDLPDKYYNTVERFTKCQENVDLLIVMGTSLSVRPVSEFPDHINGNAIRVVMNLDMNREIKDIFDFNATENRRDLFIAGKCDETIDMLCKMLQWEGELNDIHQNCNHLANKIVKSLNQPGSSAIGEAKNKESDGKVPEDLWTFEEMEENATIWNCVDGNWRTEWSKERCESVLFGSLMNQGNAIKETAAMYLKYWKSKEWYERHQQSSETHNGTDDGVANELSAI